METKNRKYGKSDIARPVIGRGIFALITAPRGFYVE